MSDRTTIWKFPLTQENVDMPQGSRLLTVQIQHGVPTLWAEVNPKEETVTRRLAVIGTGWVDGIPEHLGYIATFQQGVMVFHVYDLGEAAEAPQ